MSRPQFRVPEREKELSWWQERKKVLLPLIEKGYTSDQIATQLKTISASQVRSNYQRLYNELGLPKGQRNSVTLIRAIYARGWLSCPCGCSIRVGVGNDTTEENGSGDPEA